MKLGESVEKIRRRGESEVCWRIKKEEPEGKKKLKGRTKERGDAEKLRGRDGRRHDWLAILKVCTP